MSWRRSPSWLTRSADGGRGGTCRRKQALTLCLITDRRRLTAACGISASLWASTLLRQVEGAIAGGVDVVQIRERDLTARDLFTLTRRCVAAAAGSRTRIIVNDRADVAIAAAAAGVHLRETSIGIADARRVGPALIVGRSVHDAATVERARTADYLIAGSVFETATKPGAPPTLTLEGLREVVQAAGPCPVWAIGGITPETMPAVARCGVQGVAAIGAFLPVSPPTDLSHEVEMLARTLRFSFDTTRSDS